jgi:multidrug efflux pump
MLQDRRMNISAPFVARPVATTLLTLAITLGGILGFVRLPVSPLPQVDFPTIAVSAQLPGASPSVLGSSVAAPLERHLGRIADVTEMTSQSTVGQTRITLQFGIGRDINGAARDVQAAINAATSDLPTNLPSNPTYRKINPIDAPILILALTSKTMTQGQIYDVASNLLAQRLSQLSGIGNVSVSGSALPAVRVELNPYTLYKYGIGLEDVRAALASANANSPKGTINDGEQRYQIYTNDQAMVASDYVPLVIAYRNGAAVRLSDVAEVRDSVQDLRNIGLSNGQVSVLLLLFRQPNANILDTLDAVKRELPHLEATLPADLIVIPVMDRSITIRAALRDTEMTLLIAVILVTIVVFLFLGSISATLIPAAAILVSIIGTFGVIYLLGYSLNLLTLMALTIATGFVVDDAIVVFENISRYAEQGVPRLQATLRGAREVGFTVLSISLSLVAVFTPILLLGGVLGRLFREFTVTLSIAVLVSLAISLTTTPLMCAAFLKTRPLNAAGHRAGIFERIRRGYGHTLTWALRHAPLVLVIFIAMICLNVALYVTMPKGLFPEQDTGRMFGWLQADQSVSFEQMSGKLKQMSAVVRDDPAVEGVVGFTGAGSGFGGSSNTATVYVSLKPSSQRPPINQVIERLRPKFDQVPSGRLYLAALQDLRAGGRQGSAEYQYTLLADNEQDLYEWTPKLVDALSHSDVLVDVNSDQQQQGLNTYLDIDRDTTARLGITPRQIDDTLYDSFGQRQVSVIYSAINQYHVVMEVDPRYARYPSSLRDVYISTSGDSPSGTATTNAPAGTVTPVANARQGAVINTQAEVKPVTGTWNPATGAVTTTVPNSPNNEARNTATNALANTGNGATSAGAAVSTSQETMIPLAAVSRYHTSHVALSVSHQGLFVASTLSFNLRAGRTLSEAATEIQKVAAEISMPATIHGEFVGTSQLFEQSAGMELSIIFAAIATVYILLGILYESYTHPLVILSVLPPAGVGALLALKLFNMEFDIIGMIGVVLLIGITMKNAIMMVDFANGAERSRKLSSEEAIYDACLQRFRPILITTAAAILGALPLAASFGDGGEIRKPLGIAVVGGLIVSQLLTLYTTPVLYLYIDRIRLFGSRLSSASLV